MKPWVIDLDERFPIPNLPGYSISKSGFVYRESYTKRSFTAKGAPRSWEVPLRRLKIYLNAEYPQFSVEKTTHKLHRALAITFIPNPDGLPQVNHKDGDKFNYNLDNLEWCTASDNVIHSYKTGLASNKGSRHPQSLLCEEEVLEIKSLIRLYNPSNLTLAEKFGVHHSTISKIRRGHLWGHVNLESS